MKINEILTEAATSGEEARDQMYAALSTCNPYMKAVGGERNALANSPIYRGVRNLGWESYDAVRVVPVKQDRKPTDMLPHIHQLIDDWFFNKFGIRFRSAAIFGTGDEFQAGKYGEVTIAVPSGRFAYAWSPKVDDLYTHLRYVSSSGTGWYNLNATADDIAAVMEACDYRCNVGLVDAIRSNNEIMISCKKVVLLNPSWCS